MSLPEVRRGQVWADNDTRCAGRTLAEHLVDERFRRLAVQPAEQLADLLEGRREPGARPERSTIR